jgi:integrase
MATGIVKRHSRRCRTNQGGRCNCTPSYQAWISQKVGGRHRKIKKTFSGEGAFPAAKAWREDAGARKRSGVLRQPTKVTLRQEAEDWIRRAKAGEIRLKSGRAYKPSTLRGYERALTTYVYDSEIGFMRLTEIRRPNMQEFCDELLALGLSGSTVRNILNPLQAIYRRALARDRVAINPTTGIELPTDEEARDRIASPNEAMRLLAALPPEDVALWATGFYGGLRRGELRALRVCDVDLGKSEIRVEFTWDDVEGPVPPKSAAGERTVPLLAALRDYLDELIIGAGRGGEDLLFGRTAHDPFVPSTVRNRALAAWEAAGGLEPITLHECRHTFASMLIHAGVNPKAIQEFMGHSTIEMTFDRYGHLMPGSRDEARACVDAYLSEACGPTAGQTVPFNSGPQRSPAGSESA